MCICICKKYKIHNNIHLCVCVLRVLFVSVHVQLVGGFNHLEKYEFVNGKDDIPYMKWKMKNV